MGTRPAADAVAPAQGGMVLADEATARTDPVGRSGVVVFFATKYVITYFVASADECGHEQPNTNNTEIEDVGQE